MKTFGMIGDFLQLLLGIMVGISNHAVIYSLNGIESNEEIVKNLTDCVYFSIVTWTTLGYGDFQPLQNIRMIAASEALMGYFYMGLFLGVFMKSSFGRNQQEISAITASSIKKLNIAATSIPNLNTASGQSFQSNNSKSSFAILFNSKHENQLFKLLDSLSSDHGPKSAHQLQNPISAKTGHRKTTGTQLVPVALLILTLDKERSRKQDTHVHFIQPESRLNMVNQWLTIILDRACSTFQFDSVRPRQPDKFCRSCLELTLITTFNSTDLNF